MKKIIYLFLSISFLFSIQYTPQEKKFLENHPIIYMSAMSYWPTDSNGESIHTNYMKLINKYGHINLQPVFYKHWSNGFNDAKNGITYGIMALSYSKEREKYFFFTKTYNYHPYYLIVNKNSNIYSLKDLKNKTIAIAKNSILRQKFKNSDFKIIYAKKPFELISQNKLDGIMLFYIGNIDKNKYRIIKVFIDKNGEEHIGINKKYPILYSIITKIINEIPYNELEKIKNHIYQKNIVIDKIFAPKITIKNLITKQDIIFLTILLIGFSIILFLFATKKFLNLKIKHFFISIFIFNSVILGFIIYEILIFNYYSNKILEIKSKSFNSIYLIDTIEDSLINLNNTFLKKYHHKTAHLSKLFANKKISTNNLLINHKPLKTLNKTKLSYLELNHLATIKNQITELLKLQKDVLNNKIDIEIYTHKYISLIESFKKIKIIIKKENILEIKLIQKKLKYQFLLLLFSALIFIIENIFIFIMIKRKLYNPITYLTNTIKAYKQNKPIQKQTYYNDEIGYMIEEFFSLQNQLNQKIKELQIHKQNLEHEIKQEVDKRIHQEKILLKQSRLALMGEMIDAIAHQWKQPLNAISLHLEILNMEKQNIDEKYIENFISDINLQIQHMITTLNEFRNFFRENKEKELFCIDEIIENSLILLKDELLKNKIEIKKEINSNFCIKGIKNEFEHLLITLITNAKDIFNERNIKTRYITIKTDEDENYYYLKIIDNAGGIPEEIKDKIFDLNYTTRKDGTGVGLYLASQIAIKHMGSLNVKNVENGVCFYFKVRK